MKTFLFRLFLLISFVLLQLSFFDILFPWFRVPLFLLGAVVVFSLVRGFPQALVMTLPLTLLFDAASLGAVSWFSLLAVAFSYGTGFLSRRLLIEHRGFGLVLYALVAYGGAILCQIFFAFSVPGGASLEASVLKPFFPSAESIWFSLLLFMPTFGLTFVSVKSFEKYLAERSERQFRNIR